MSALREERAALPAIGEDTKTQAEMSALLDALRSGGNTLPVGVQQNLDMLLPRIPIRPVVRRRFNSSDPVLKSHYARSSSNSSSQSNGNGGVHSPHSMVVVSGRSFGDSPSDLRRALLSRSAAAAASLAGGALQSEAELAQLRRLRSQRRTCSETHAKLLPFDALGPLDAGPDDSGDGYDGVSYDDGDITDDGGDELSGGDERRQQQLWSKSRRASDDVSVSSLSSLYSSPATTPHSRSLSFATDSDRGGGSGMSESYEKLRNLQKLFQEGFITVTEYKDRRLQLVDEIGTPERTIAKATDLIMTDLPIVYREPPDFTLLRERDAIKHVFDSEQRKWTSCPIKVKLDTQPFARGGLRQVFHMQDLSVNSSDDDGGGSGSFVAKVAINPHENPDTYFRDVEMQAVAAKFAKLYNSYHPPRRVEFLAAWILQLLPASSDDDDANPADATLSGSICGVEPFIAGEYRKHNNNFGFVSDYERSTPQAFSHFTYEASGHQILVVDIQGVGDHYTDPQIHTRRGEEFGKGNLARRGFERFLESHRCNLICRYLKLPLNNPKDADDTLLGGASGVGGDASGNGIGGVTNGAVDPKGTVPAQPFMSQPRVRVDRVDSELCHYYGDSSAFKSYKAKRARALQQQQQQASDGAGNRMAHFVEAMKTQPNCSAWCGVSSACRIS